MAREYKLKRDSQDEDNKTVSSELFQRYIKKDKRSINEIIKQQNLMAKVYMFLANGSEEIESLIPVDVFRRGGVEVKTVSITGSEYVEMAHGVVLKADMKFEDADFSDADLLMLPGGLPGATNLNEHEGVRKAVLSQYESGKLVAAICAAPMVLGSLGIVEGKRATCYPGFEKYLTGAEYTHELCTVDGNVVTGEGPAATLPYAYTLLAMLTTEQTAHGLPVLMHTIRAFRSYNDAMRIILVLPKAQQEYWKELCEEYSFHEPVMLADGGETRFHSVKNGLDMIPDDDDGIVGVHDGVRPFPSGGTIYRAVKEAEKTGAAVPVVPVVDTLRHLFKVEMPEDMYETDRQSSFVLGGEIHSATVQRDEYRIVQTPQVFGVQVLKKAYRQEYKPEFTDDASVVEHDGHEVALVEGNRENIKITTPFDLAVAEAILRNA